MKNMGINFEWFVLDEGEKHGGYKHMIKNLGIEEHFELLGYSTNPYTFI